LNAYENYDFTFSDLLNNLSISRDPSRIPLTPVFLNVQSEAYDHCFYNLVNKSLPGPKAFETFELAVNIDDLPSGLTLRWDYNSDLFDPETIEYFHGQFESIISQISDQPYGFLRNVTIKAKLTDGTLIKRIEKWNDTYCAYPK